MNNSRKLYHYAVDTFVELLSQIRGKKIRYKCSDTDFANWDFFAFQYRNVNIGESYVREFIEFGLNYWYVVKQRDPRVSSCRFMNIFNKAMLARWDKLHPEFRTKIIRTELKQEYDIKIKKSSRISELVNQVRTGEERFKAQYHNKKKGLAWCIANTSLYFHKSSLCATCENKSICKDELKRQYPKVYKMRGYES